MSCDIKLNFLETKSINVIKNMVDYDKERISDKYSWFPGKQNRSHGGFIKIIGKDKNGLKAFILPKIKKLEFTDNKKTDSDIEKANVDRMPGDLVLVGDGTELRFLKVNANTDERKLLLSFSLCKSSLDEPSLEEPDEDDEFLDEIPDSETQSVESLNDNLSIGDVTGDDIDEAIRSPVDSDISESDLSLTAPLPENEFSESDSELASDLESIPDIEMKMNHEKSKEIPKRTRNIR